MHNKRGEMTTNEIIKMVIGIIILGFMIYLGYKLAGVITTNRDVEKAKSTFEDLTFQIEKLEEGQEKTFLVEGPSEWFFYSFSGELCFFPLSCLDSATKKDLLTDEQIKAGADNVLPICRSSGFCKSSLNVKIPYDYIDYKTGYHINYYAQFLFGYSELVMANVFHALLIGKDMVPQTIKIQKINGVVNIINMPSTKELSLIKSIIDVSHGLGVGQESSVDLSSAEGEYLHWASMDKGKINLVCLCDSEQDDDCEKGGLCMMSVLKMILPSNPVEITKESFMLKINKVDDVSFRASL
jgi:hypothetical protein